MIIRETALDRDRERRIINAMCAASDMRWRKLTPEYRIDFALLSRASDRITSIVEVKARNCGPNEFPHMIVDAGKIAAGILWSKAFKVSFYVAFGFSDGTIKTCRMGEERMPLEWHARLDRGDPRDSEPVVMIPQSCMSVLEGVDWRAFEAAGSAA